MTRYVSVLGTWAYDGEPDASEWWHPGSAFSRWLATHGLAPLWPEDPYVWDGVADGVWPFRRARLSWQAAGANLASRLVTVPLRDRNLIAHSHGGQVALEAAKRIPIRRLITVATPVRRDMHETAVRALAQGVGWWHVYSPGWSDKMQLLGALFDGAWSLERRMLYPGVQNVGIPGGVGHSGLLRDPATFHWWAEAGMVGFLTEPSRLQATTLRPVEVQV